MPCRAMRWIPAVTWGLIPGGRLAGEQVPGYPSIPRAAALRCGDHAWLCAWPPGIQPLASRTIPGAWYRSPRSLLAGTAWLARTVKYRG